MKQIRFGIAGLKHFHILEFAKGMKLLPGSEFVGFYEDDEALRNTYENEFGVNGYSDLESFVEATTPEIVGVAVENGKKSEVITHLASLGCHVLADKPLVTDLKQLDGIEKAASVHGRQIGLMLLERYHAPTYTVHKMIQEGDLGTLVSFIAIAPHKLKPEGRPAWMFDPSLYGGVLNDLAIHNIDLATWLWNDDPVSVTASEGCLRFKQFERFTDHAGVFLEFADTSTAMIRIDWMTPEMFPSHGDGRQFYEGTQGTVEVIAAPDIHALGKGTIHFDSWHDARKALTPIAPEVSLYEEFVNLCRGQKEAILLPADGFRSTRITLHARHAAETGQKVDLRGKL